MTTESATPAATDTPGAAAGADPAGTPTPAPAPASAPAPGEAPAGTAPDPGAAPSPSDPPAASTDRADPGAATGDPASYALALPEGSPLSEQAIAETATWAAEHGLTPEQAQAALEARSAAVQGELAARQSRWEATKAGFVETIKADPDMGGARFEETTANAARAIERFGSDALREALDQSGLGNHPELVRTFAQIGAAMREDGYRMGGSGSPGEARSHADRIYGDG